MKIDQDMLDDCKAVTVFLLGCVAFAALILFLNGCESKDLSPWVSPTVPECEPADEPTAKLLMDDSRSCESKFGLAVCLYCTTMEDDAGCLADLHRANNNGVLDLVIWPYIAKKADEYQLAIFNECLAENGVKPIVAFTTLEGERVLSTPHGPSCLALIEAMNATETFDKGRYLERRRG